MSNSFQTNSEEKLKEAYEITREQFEAGFKERKRSDLSLFLSSLWAELELGFSLNHENLFLALRELMKHGWNLDLTCIMKSIKKKLLLKSPLIKFI